jgi:hypothetical protein
VQSRGRRSPGRRLGRCAKAPRRRSEGTRKGVGKGQGRTATLIWFVYLPDRVGHDLHGDVLRRDVQAGRDQLLHLLGHRSGGEWGGRRQRRDPVVEPPLLEGRLTKIRSAQGMGGTAGVSRVGLTSNFSCSCLRSRSAPAYFTFQSKACKHAHGTAVSPRREVHVGEYTSY